MKVRDTNHVADFHDLCPRQVHDFVGDLSRTLSRTLSQTSRHVEMVCVRDFRDLCPRLYPQGSFGESRRDGIRALTCVLKFTAAAVVFILMYGGFRVRTMLSSACRKFIQLSQRRRYDMLYYYRIMSTIADVFLRGRGFHVGQRSAVFDLTGPHRTAHR